jgi:SpoVK/Ycf46/Vps4 family AAA+-type ATPase
MTSFMGTVGGNWETHQHQFAKSLLEINRRIYREKKARSLARERKVLKFETAAEMKKEERELRIRLRGFSFARAIDAMDAGELVNDVERPNTRFEDVFGARGAKESLQFVIDWLKNPKRYAAMGIRPPKGILMTGPPGTGKTMLARAVAGESNCAFIEKSASSFVTIWQGSGPQNVRDLFGRARRYAPSIVFIDELDAIGIKRSGVH